MDEAENECNLKLKAEKFMFSLYGEEAEWRTGIAAELFRMLQQVHTTARMEAAMECVSIADSLGWDITPVAGGRGHDPMDWGVQIASEIRKHFGLEGKV